MFYYIFLLVLNKFNISLQKSHESKKIATQFTISYWFCGKSYRHWVDVSVRPFILCVNGNRFEKEIQMSQKILKKGFMLSLKVL